MTHSAAPTSAPSHAGPNSASHRITLITGATAGIGRETTRELVQRGQEVYILGRSKEKLRRTQAETGAAGYFEADLSEMSEVAAAARQIARELPKLDVLLNNAGAIFDTRRETREGLEMTWALNVLTPHLLVRELGPTLRRSDDPRAITVSSMAHRMSRSDFADPLHLVGYSAWGAYADSKLAATLLAREWARRAPWLSSHSLHPGFVASNFNAQSGGALGTVWPALTGAFAISALQGAATSVHLASAPSLGLRGGYWNECQPERPSSHALDDGLALKVWNLCEEQLVKLGLA